jgi:predicted nucleic acid-binding protein
LDASTVLTWCFPDEETQKATEIAEWIAGGATVVVPAFWRHEILNALLVGEKRKRLTLELVQAFLADLNRLPVDVDGQTTPEVVFERTQTLCPRHGLTAYDAAYLEIAVRHRHPLATTDADLKRAATAEGVRVL